MVPPHRVESFCQPAYRLVGPPGTSAIPQNVSPMSSCLDPSFQPSLVGAPDGLRGALRHLGIHSQPLSFTNHVSTYPRVPTSQLGQRNAVALCDSQQGIA